MVPTSIVRTSVVVMLAASLAGAPASRASGTEQRAQPPAKLQPRPHSSRVAVDVGTLHVDDGDTVGIRWPQDRGAETVRLLGIDCPETRHVEHDIPYDQAFGAEARAFLEGVFASATRIELLRAATLDPYDRSLGYLFVDGRNTSVLAIQARLAYESVSTFGDNGFPSEAAQIKAAAEKAGPLPFEPPYQFRARMRDVAQWMKRQGTYPIRETPREPES